MSQLYTILSFEQMKIINIRKIWWLFDTRIRQNTVLEVYILFEPGWAQKGPTQKKYLKTIKKKSNLVLIKIKKQVIPCSNLLCNKFDFVGNPFLNKNEHDIILDCSVVHLSQKISVQTSRYETATYQLTEIKELEE